VRLLKCATPVKAKTSAPAPDLPASCAALTWRGLATATRTGSRDRGGGRRQTLDRQENTGRVSAPSGQGTLREPFGRLRWSHLNSQLSDWKGGGPLFR